jgi:hypothetical protein
MLSRWRFTTDEMMVLWPYVGVSAFPFPIQIQSVVPTHEERRMLEQRARGQLERAGVLRRGRLDVDLHAALQTLVHPLLSCAAFGFVGTRSESKVRVLGAHAGGVGVLAVQEPGVRWDLGADVTIGVVRAAELAGAVVGGLPPAPAGKAAPIRVRTADLRTDTHDQVSVTVTATSEQRSVQRLAELTSGPVAGGGQFTVVTAQQATAPVMTSTVTWFDRPDDGRYLMARGETTRVAPADFRILAAELNQQLSGATRRA